MIDGIKNFSFKSALAFNQVQTSPILSQTLSKRGIFPQQQNGDVFVKNNSDNKNKLSIYYYNDTHGNSDQMAGLINAAQTFKQEHKDDSTLILSGGDNSSGGDVQKNEFIFDLMENAIGVDASAIGNHEIDGKKEGFKDAIKEKNIPFIATNVEFDDEELNKLIKKSEIIEKNGVKYGLVGAMPIDFTTCSKKEAQEGVDVDDFDDTVEHLQEEINKLRQQGVDRIILLSHSSFETDKQLAQNLDGVDIIIGGHSHTVVEGIKEGENLLKTKSQEPVIITQAGENGKYWGNLDVEFSDNGIITKANNQLIQSTNREKSPVIEYVKDSKLGKSKVVGKLTYIEPMPDNRKKEPCGWTCTMADSMRSELGVDIAIINSANIRKVPKAGTLTERDISESAPMKNKLLKTKITQKQLVEAVKSTSKSTLSTKDGDPGLLQGSGFGYKIDDKGNLLEMYVLDKKGNRTPIDIENPSDKITYSASYDSFVAQENGETPNLVPRFKVEEFDFDKDKTMTDYLSKLSDTNDIQIKYDNRIEIVKT